MRILGTLFDAYHMGYIIISLGLTSLFIYLGVKFIKHEKYKDMYLKFWAWVTFLLHLSPLWVEFLKGNPAIAADNQLFPIYFCNMSMYLLLIVAIWGNKKTKTFNYLATFAAYAGALGALISLFYPEYYLGEGARMFEWGVFKSMLSHSTMLIGSIYLLAGGYFKVDKKNVIAYAGGLLVYGLIGVIVNVTFQLAGLYEPNAMFMQRPPIEEVPFLNFYVIAIMMLLVVFITSWLYEIGRERYHAHATLVNSKQH